MKNLYKQLAKVNEQRKKYFEDPLFYGKKLKRKAEKLFPGARVFLFGSVIRREYQPDSDFDVLVVTKKAPADIFEQAKAKIEILKAFPHHPFELHLITPEQFESWYQRFIKNDYQELK